MKTYRIIKVRRGIGRIECGCGHCLVSLNLRGKMIKHQFAGVSVNAELGRYTDVVLSESPNWNDRGVTFEAICKACDEKHTFRILDLCEACSDKDSDETCNAIYEGIYHAFRHDQASTKPQGKRYEQRWTNDARNLICSCGEPLGGIAKYFDPKDYPGQIVREHPQSSAFMLLNLLDDGLGHPVKESTEQRNVYLHNCCAEMRPEYGRYSFMMCLRFLGQLEHPASPVIGRCPRCNTQHRLSVQARKDLMAYWMKNIPTESENP